ncbi:Hypothetical predicted protein [Marmota monax]|uniref:Uncharacterized protein n=1 Tax=Marmota monax TaxID=9995 RepID=A0A5E4BKB5_MARMO|nr:Hypothetical predicted protein [Marmota monax]
MRTLPHHFPQGPGVGRLAGWAAASPLTLGEMMQEADRAHFPLRLLPATTLSSRSLTTVLDILITELKWIARSQVPKTFFSTYKQEDDRKILSDNHSASRDCTIGSGDKSSFMDSIAQVLPFPDTGYLETVSKTGIEKGIP